MQIKRFQEDIQKVSINSFHFLNSVSSFIIYEAQFKTIF